MNVKFTGEIGFGDISELKKLNQALIIVWGKVYLKHRYGTSFLEHTIYKHTHIFVEMDKRINLVDGKYIMNCNLQFLHIHGRHG